MRKLPLQLNTYNPITNQINLEFGEDYFFLQLHKFSPQHFLTVTTKIRDQQTIKIIKCSKLMRLNVFGYTSVKLSGNLVDDEQIEGEICMVPGTKSLSTTPPKISTTIISLITIPKTTPYK